MPPSALDYHPCLFQSVEDDSYQQLIPQMTSATPVCRTASATGRLCAVSASTCCNLATISSTLRLFLLVSLLILGPSVKEGRQAEMSSLPSFKDHLVRDRIRKLSWAYSAIWNQRYSSLRKARMLSHSFLKSGFLAEISS
jgi:hypothetical protein